MYIFTTVRYSMFNHFLLVLFNVMLVTLVTGRSLQETKEKLSPRCPVAKDLIPLPFPHPNDCSIFFVCNNGTSIELQCLADLHFDAEKRQCLNKESVICKSQTGQPQPAFAVCPPINGADVVMFPHPVDCSMYYVCDHGIPYPRKCPKGLHYNRELRVCDYEHRAKCILVFVAKH